MFISPTHIEDGTGLPFHERDTEILIDLFYARTDGWQLEVADRCINGWEHNGNPCITTKDRQGRDVNYVPDSAWAVLQIVLNYFETVGFFKMGPKKYRSFHYNYFRDGVYDVFPEFIDHPHNIARKLYSDARGSLYHTGINKGGVVLRHDRDTIAIAFEEGIRRLVIDPHLLVPRLREHLRDYCTQLKRTDEAELRENFRSSFIARIQG